MSNNSVKHHVGRSCHWEQLEVWHFIQGHFDWAVIKAPTLIMVTSRATVILTVVLRVSYASALI